MMPVWRVVVAVFVALLFPALALAQAPYPPNQWHPYRGGTNCIQVVDSNGNFNCYSGATIDPTTGVFSLTSAVTTRTPVYGALVVASLATNSTYQALGNDIVFVKQTSAVAPAGPGVGAAVLRLRPSPITPGYCQVVIAAGNSFNQEIPIAFVNPTYAFLGGVANRLSTSPNFGDIVTFEIPGGPGGC